jgi:hypothetical protein
MTDTTMFMGITQAQSLLVSYWAARRGGDGRVPRASIDAGDLRAMLASISIVEFGADGRGRFRIAGSRLCELFGMEARGHMLADVLGDHGEAFSLGLSAALERRHPVGGLIETDRADPDQMHAWLRLPLAGPDGQLSQVLCHDELVYARAVINPAHVPVHLRSLPLRRTSPHAAA